ncbi:MAG: hypothetical protein HY242_07755 [Afipia sp.]|nr:hypothetical protein [Afipia sp.]
MVGSQLISGLVRSFRKHGLSGFGRLGRVSAKLLDRIAFSSVSRTGIEQEISVGAGGFQKVKQAFRAPIEFGSHLNLLCDAQEILDNYCALHYGEED